MAPTSTAVFRAVADFASLNREVARTRKNVEQLQAQAGRTGGWDKFDAALQKTAKTQQDLRKETDALASAQSKLGKSSGVTNLTNAVNKLAAAQEKARVSSTSLTAAQSRQASVVDAAKTRMSELASATRDLALADEKASKGASAHAKALTTEKQSADAKQGSLAKLAESLRRVTEREDAAVTSSKAHVEQLYKETAASKVAADQHGNLAKSTTEAGRAAKIAGGDHDLLRESLDRLSPSARSAGSSLGQHASAIRGVGSVSNATSASQNSLASAVGRGAAAARSAGGAHRSFGSAMTQTASSSRSASAANNQYATSARNVGSASQSGGRGVNQMATVLNPLKTSLHEAGLAGQGLRTVLLGLGFAAVVPAVMLLVGAISSLVSGLVSLVAAAAPAAGVLAALGPAALAAAGAFATVKLAFRGVGDALSAMTKLDQQSGQSATTSANQRRAAARAIVSAQRGVRDAIQGQQDAERQSARAIADAQRALTRARQEAADNAVQAARRVEDAQRSLARAERDAALSIEAADRRVADANRALISANQRVVKSERDLHAARRQAIRDLEDLSDRVHDNALDEEGAEIALIRARERLAEANADYMATDLDRREAALGVAEAEDRLNDIRRQSARDQSDLNEANAAGVDGMAGVVAAQESLASAQEAAQEASRDLALAEAEASRARTDAAEQVADAQRSLSDALDAQRKSQTDSAERIAEAERNLTEAREDAARRQRDAAERVADAQDALREAMERQTEATGAQSAAARALDAAWAKLSPRGRELVMLLRELQPKLDEMSRAGQEAFFPGLISAIKILVPMIDSVAIPSIKAIGEELGKTAVNGAKEFKSWEDDLKAFGKGDAPILLHQFGVILINLASAAEDVTMAAVPLAYWLAQLGVRLSGYWAKEAETGRRNGTLKDYFESVKRTLELLGDIIYNVGGQIKEVLRAAEPAGTRLLESFRDLTAETRAWMGTAEGRNTMREYFDAVEVNVRILMQLLGKLALAFIKIGASPQVTRMLESIRDTLGPSLSRFVTALGVSFDKLGPKMVDILAGILDFFSTLMEAGDGGALSTFVSIIGGLIDVLNVLVNIPMVPWLMGMVGAAVAVKVAFGAILKMVLGLTKAIPGVSLLNKALGGQALNTSPGNGPAGTFKQGFTQGFAGNQQANTGTGKAGVAIGGAVGGAASTLSGGRTGTNNTGGAHQAGGGGIPVAQLVAAQRAATGTTAALNAASTAATGFGARVGAAAGTATGGFSRVTSAVRGVASTSIGAASSIATGFKSTASSIAGSFTGVGRQVGAGMLPAQTAAASTGSKITSAFKSAASSVGSAFTSTAASVGSKLSGVATAASSVGSKVTGTLGGAATTVSGRFSSLASSVGSAFSGMAAKVGDAVAPITSKVTNAAKDAATGVKSWTDKIAGSWTGAYGGAASAAEKAATGVSASSRRMGDEAERTGSRIGNAFRNLGSYFSGSAKGVEEVGTKAAGATGGITRAAEAMEGAGQKTGVMRTAMGGLVSFLGGPWGVALAAVPLVIGGIAAAYDSLSSKADEAAKSVLDGSMSIQQAVDKEAAQIQKRNLVMEQMQGEGYATGQAIGELTGQTQAHSEAVDVQAQALSNVLAELDKQIAKAGPAEQAQLRVQKAQALYNEEVRKFGADSPQARQAAESWRLALDGVKSKTDEAATATQTLSGKILAQQNLMLDSLDADLQKQQSLLSVKDAQKSYNDAVNEYGPTSDEAQAANIRMQQAMSSYITQAAAAAVKQAEMNGITDDGSIALSAQRQAALDLAATHQGPLPEALQKIIGGMDQTSLAALGAKVKIDETGQAVVTLPNGKTVKIDADNADALAKIGAVQQQLLTMKNGVTVPIYTSVINGEVVRGGIASAGRLAGGGVVPGFSPGRDTVPAVLSPGEAVLVPELVKKIGAKNILAANKAASGRSPETFGKGAGHYAGGGVVGRPTAQGGNTVGGTAAPTPVDPSAVSASAKALQALNAQVSALTPQLAEVTSAGAALLQTGLTPLKESGLVPLTAELLSKTFPTLDELKLQLGEEVVKSAVDLRTVGLLPLRTDLVTTQTQTQASALAMTAAVQSHDVAANASLLNVRNAGLLPLRTDLTTTQQTTQGTTTAMTNAMSLHRDLSNAATLNIRQAGLNPLRADMDTTAVNTSMNTISMTGSVQGFNTQANAALSATRSALSATDTAVGNTANWWGQQMGSMREAAAAPVRDVIRGPFNAGIIKAWNQLDAQFTLNKRVPDVPIGFAKGGPLRGGEANKDSIPIMGMPGEYMLSKKAVNKLGGQGAVDQWHRKLRAGLTPQDIDQGGDKSAPGWAHMAEGGPVAAGQNFARSQAGKPYVWGGVGPGGYDCSGFMSAIVGSITGGNPFQRRFSTASFAGGPTAGFVRGLSSAFSIGVMQGNPGHMAGTLGGLNVESRGGQGVVVGPSARGADNGLFTSQFSLPMIGGTFVSGGGGGVPFDPTPIVNAAFGDTYKMLDEMGKGANAHKAMMVDIARQAADAVKSKALGAVSAATAMSGPLAGAAGGGSASVRAAVQAVAARYGWGDGPQWAALDKLIQGESGWNPSAANPTSSARGLFQKMTSVNGPVEPTAAGQAEWGLNYIRSRYGDPIKAYATWSSRSPHWYAQGGFVPGQGNRDSEPGMLTPGEFVIKKSSAVALGADTLHALNNFPRMFAAGGTVSDDYKKYKIKSGDTLSDIANRFNVTIKALQDLNKIKDVNKIKADSWLQLPQWASDNNLGEVERNQKKAKRYVSSLKLVSGGWLDKKGRFVSAAGLKVNASILDDGTVAIYENGKKVTNKGAGYAYKNNKANGGFSSTYTGGEPKPADGSETPPASGGGGTGSTTDTSNLGKYLASLQGANAQQKEFEANLLKLAGWGYSKLANALAKMGIKSASTSSDEVGGLALSREAIQSPATAAKIEATLAEAEGFLNDKLATVLTIIGALKSTAGLGIREVSTRTKISTDDIFEAMEGATAQAELAKLPAANRDKFLANLTAYKNGVAFATGGRVGGTGNRDTVPAMLTPGEFVLRKSAARALGLETLHRLNNADTQDPQLFANGGPVLRAEDLFSLVSAPNARGTGLSSAVKQALSNAANNSTTNNSGKQVIFEEGSVQVHNAVPQRSTDSFGSVMQKLSWSGAFA